MRSHWKDCSVDIISVIVMRSHLKDCSVDIISVNHFNHLLSNSKCQHKTKRPRSNWNIVIIFYKKANQTRVSDLTSLSEIDIFLASTLTQPEMQMPGLTYIDEINFSLLENMTQPEAALLFYRWERWFVCVFCRSFCGWKGGEEILKRRLQNSRPFYCIAPTNKKYCFVHWIFSDK